MAVMPFLRAMTPVRMDCGVHNGLASVVVGVAWHFGAVVCKQEAAALYPEANARPNTDVPANNFKDMVGAFTHTLQHT